MVVIQHNDLRAQRSTLLIFIEPDNLGRMEKADPLTLLPQHQGGAIAGVVFPYNLRVVIAYEPEPGKLHEMVNAGASFAEFLEFAVRGYRFEAKDGLLFAPGSGGTA